MVGNRLIAIGTVFSGRIIDRTVLNLVDYSRVVLGWTVFNGMILHGEVDVMIHIGVGNGMALHGLVDRIADKDNFLKGRVCSRCVRAWLTE
jgi:hypothetical protein